MSDVYGKMILNQSEGLVCAVNELVKALNLYEWNGCEIGWATEIYNGESYIGMDCDPYQMILSPTVFPRARVGDGVDDELFLNECDYQSELSQAYDADEPSLETLTNVISKHIASGQIEIAVIRSDKYHFVAMDRLVIRSDGTATRSGTKVGQGYSDEYAEDV